MNKKYVVRLSDSERDACQEIIKNLKGSSQKFRRAQILLKADADGPGWSDDRVAEAFNCRTQTIENVRKRYLISAAAHNLGLLMRSLFKIGTPRGLQQFKTDLEGIVSSAYLAWLAATRFWKTLAHSTGHPINSRALTEPETNLALVA